MKAAQYKKYGKSDVIEINPYSPEPVLKNGQVLVEVHSAGINPFDIKLRLGFLKDSMPIQFPYTMGGDFSGVITQIGAEVTGYKKGDEIFGSAQILSGGSGAFAEIAAANTKNISQKPKNLNFLESASLPLVGSSAVQAIEEHINLKDGQKILIHGGAGGIGSIAIQLAKYLGAYVATTAGTNDLEFVKNLGADQVIDYKTQKFEEILKDFDAVYDTVGGETTKNSFKVLKKGGILVSMLGKPDENLAKQYAVSVVGQGTHTNSAHLTRLSELVESGAIKPQIDRGFSLDQTKEAFDHLEKGSQRGKVVLKIRD